MLPVWPPAVKGFQGKIQAFWFGANASGLDSPETLELLARHAVAGYGWQQGHTGGGRVGRGEALLAAAATHARDYFDTLPAGAPAPALFIYRQVQVALGLFAQTALASDESFFLHDASGRLCTAAQPWGTQDMYWNFSSAGAAQYWLDSVVGELTSESALLGGGGAVFFDEVDQGTCGYRGGSCDFGAFAGENPALQAASNAVLSRTVRTLNAAGITPILSLDNRLAASAASLPPSLATPCALPEDALLDALSGAAWVRFYENWPQSFWVPGGPDLAAAMVANALLETAAGVPVVLHAGGACPAPPRQITRPGRLGGDIEAAVATYLLVAGPTGATLSISDDWYDASFCWRPDFDVDFGAPLAPAVRTGTHSWVRTFARANVTVDVASGGESTVFLLA